MNKSNDKTTTTWWVAKTEYDRIVRISSVEVAKESTKTLLIRISSSWSPEGYRDFRVNKVSESARYFNNELEAHQFALAQNKIQREYLSKLMGKVANEINQSISFIEYPEGY